MTIADTTHHASHDLLPAWLALGIYVAGFVITARIFFATDDTTEDRSENRFVAGMVGFLWPLIFALLVIAGLVYGLVMLPTLGAKTKRDRQRQRQRQEQEQQLRAQEAVLKRQHLEERTAELEAENDRLRRAIIEPD